MIPEVAGLVREQHFKDGEDLRDMLLKSNVARGRRMVCYDGSVVAAAKLAFAGSSGQAGGISPRPCTLPESAT